MELRQIKETEWRLFPHRHCNQAGPCKTLIHMLCFSPFQKYLDNWPEAHFLELFHRCENSHQMKMSTTGSNQHMTLRPLEPKDRWCEPLPCYFIINGSYKPVHELITHPTTPTPTHNQAFKNALLKPLREFGILETIHLPPCIGAFTINAALSLNTPQRW